MTIIPITLARANEFVALFHRHSRPTVGGRFAIGLEHESELIGCAIVGRPVARQVEHHFTAEVLRCCTRPDSPKGSVSMLYRACWRAWIAMGGTRMLTYTLKSESGSSLRGSGWRLIGEVKPVSKSNGWLTRNRFNDPIMKSPKLRWELSLA